jgi:hypothetical protein
MFDYKQTLTNRLSNATDLLIDFATLGEYGLEPVGKTRRSCPEPQIGKPTHPRRTPRAANRNATCNLLQEAGFRSPRQSQERKRGVRAASDPSPASGVAWQRHASRSTAA